MSAFRGEVVTGNSAELRLNHAALWLAAREETRVIVCGVTIEAATDLIRRSVTTGVGLRGAFGRRPTTLAQLAWRFARGDMAGLGRAPTPPSALDRKIPTEVLAMATAAVARLSVGALEAIVFVDVPLLSQSEQDFVAAWVARAPAALATLPICDERSVAAFAAAIGSAPTPHDPRENEALARTIFVPARPRRDGDSFDETARRRVSIARSILGEAASGVKFDRMAVVVRSEDEALHVEQTLARARIPSYFAGGNRVPDPIGRSLLTLLACAQDDLSAAHFMTYLSLGEASLERSDEGARTREGEWEHWIHEAAIIAGKARWQRRLDNLDAKLANDLDAYVARSDTRLAEMTLRDRASVASLRAFALPLVAELAEMQDLATTGKPKALAWTDWADRLERLATRAIRTPERVIEVLRGLPRLSTTEVVTLFDVRRVLEPLLSYVVVPPKGPRFGKVYIAHIEDIRGLAFDVVFAPDLALGTMNSLGLGIAKDAATTKIMVFLAENTGTATHFASDEISTAPPELAIDDTDYDLETFARVLSKPENENAGELNYILEANPHVARALRFRARRWLKTWKPVDGLVDPQSEAVVAIRAHGLDARSFSPTALQNFAACPYRFFLSAVHRLSPRTDVRSIDELDPLTRGSLVHEVQFEALIRLREAKLLPLTTEGLDRAKRLLDEALGAVEAVERERLNPAIALVWNDTMDGISSDLHEWLEQMLDEPTWRPAYFELSFGLSDARKQDARSTLAPAALTGGLQLRGSIDLVEENDAGALRATDHKTGRPRAQSGDIVKKGEVLQPVLYALTLETLFPERTIEGGRLFYCTRAGDFTKVDIALDGRARKAANLVVTTIGDALSTGFLPAAPAADACRYCDFVRVCGPHEEMRSKRKPAGRLQPLFTLRREK